MKKTEKENFEYKKVYCVFDSEGERIKLSNTKNIYLFLSKIKQALSFNLLAYPRLSDEKKFEKIKDDFKNVEIVEYQLVPTNKIIKMSDYIDENFK